jgi:anaerobic magnesium-protoporphyrin IX monomethyl ester cyclase
MHAFLPFGESYAKNREKPYMAGKSILLIGFYNPKAIGVRFLERSLVNAGFKTYILFLKDFDSQKPGPITKTELLLLKGLVASLNPGLIGLSVMSSLYLDTVLPVNEMLRRNFNIPVAWGGVYASLFPGKCLEHADYVLRGEGEKAIVELADAVLNEKPCHDIRNLAYHYNHNCRSRAINGNQAVNRSQAADRNHDNDIVINELRPLCENLDDLGYPLFLPDNKFFIDDGKLTHKDPIISSSGYELAASRGCPFACTYCSSVNLRRMYRGKGKFLRIRSVSSVISELEDAMSHMKRMKTVHFWDEIFPCDREWIDEFARQYALKIRLPFEIWGHPLKTDDYAISKLAGAGLYKVVMGIQSGSPRIRKEIFRRGETREDILKAARILNKRKVPHVIYDFMLRHPFETGYDIQKTFELCAELPKPFDLQLHGLNFLPGTDIIEIAAKNGITGQYGHGIEESMNEQYNVYWGRKSANDIVNFWYSLVYASQFGTGLVLARYMSKQPKTGLNIFIASILPKLYLPAAKLRFFYKKAVMLAIAVIAKISLAKSQRKVFQYSEGR